MKVSLLAQLQVRFFCLPGKDQNKLIDESKERIVIIIVDDDELLVSEISVIYLDP